MPPNLAYKSPSSGSKFELLNWRTNVAGKKNIVRTNFVVQNIYSYLLGSELPVPEISPNCALESEVLKSLIGVVNEFQASYSDTISELSASLEVCEDSAESVFAGVSNELFCQGVTWSRIATFFVFASEFVLQGRRKGLPDSIGDDVLDYLMLFVRDNLEKWVVDHGGWEGIVEYSNGHKDPKKDVAHDGTSSGWAKTAFVGTVKMLGTLANLASYSDPLMSFPVNRTKSDKDSM